MPIQSDLCARYSCASTAYTEAACGILGHQRLPPATTSTKSGLTTPIMMRMNQRPDSETGRAAVSSRFIVGHATQAGSDGDAEG